MKPKLNKARLFADLGYVPHAGQAEVHRSKAPRRIVACGTRWGKSLCAAMELIAALMAPRDSSLGWLVAPTYDLADRAYRNVEWLVMRRLKHRVIESDSHGLAIRNLGGGRSELRVKSSDKPASLLGEGLDFLIVDEAACPTTESRT